MSLRPHRRCPLCRPSLRCRTKQASACARLIARINTARSAPVLRIGRRCCAPRCCCSATCCAACRLPCALQHCVTTCLHMSSHRHASTEGGSASSCRIHQVQLRSVCCLPPLHPLTPPAAAAAAVSSFSRVSPQEDCGVPGPGLRGGGIAASCSAQVQTHACTVSPVLHSLSWAAVSTLQWCQQRLPPMRQVERGQCLHLPSESRSHLLTSTLCWTGLRSETRRLTRFATPPCTGTWHVLLPLTRSPPRNRATCSRCQRLTRARNVWH